MVEILTKAKHPYNLFIKKAIKMQVKLSFKNQTRKSNTEIKTVDELRKLAVKFFGDQAIYCDFMYQDDEKESVSIIDNDDLLICLEEAEENGMKSVSIQLKLSSPDTKSARSVSKKNSPQTKINEEKEEDVESFDSEDVDIAEIEAFNSSSDEGEKIKAREELEAMK